MNTQPSESLHRIADRYWNFVREERPVVALLAGQPSGDQLLREAPADHERRAAVARGFLDELVKIDRSALAAGDRASLMLLEHELGMLCELIETKGHLRPSLYPLGPEFLLASICSAVTIFSHADADHWLVRLATAPASLAGIQDCLRAGKAAGIHQPRLALKAALQNVRGALAGDPQDSLFHGPVLRAAARLSGFHAIVARSLAVVRDTVYPAMAAYADFIETELLPNARTSLACTDSPQGRDYYQMLIRQYATIDEAPEAIHALGLAEVERLEAEAAVTAKAAGFADDIESFRASLNRPDQFAADADALRAEIEVLSKRIDALLPGLFGKLPRITYGVQSIPEAVSERMPPAYAQPNPTDNSAPGVHWITSHPAKCPRYMHLPIALHEAWPGHLMHLALTQEQTELPDFRRFGAADYSACLEGWALYCERLGEEMGLYDTPQKRYGPVEMEMWRAVRLVADTGLHAMGWNREQAIDFACKHMAMPRLTIEAEVDRYIALPGQALAYQIGNLKFRGLRRRAEQRLGERFRLRDFHDALMACGPVTLPVLENMIDEWIAVNSTDPGTPSAGPPSPVRRIPITIVNHVAIDIGASLEEVWQAILDDYVKASKFREIGVIEAIDDPAAVLGAYRMRLEHDGVIDERLAYITELDHSAHRLSLFADYLTVPAGGMHVCASYHAQDVPDGTSFAIDSHTRLAIDARADMAQAIADIKIGCDASLMAYLQSFKARLEGVARPA